MVKAPFWSWPESIGKTWHLKDTYWLHKSNNTLLTPKLPWHWYDTGFLKLKAFACLCASKVLLHHRKLFWAGWPSEGGTNCQPGDELLHFPLTVLALHLQKKSQNPSLNPKCKPWCWACNLPPLFWAKFIQFVSRQRSAQTSAWPQDSCAICTALWVVCFLILSVFSEKKKTMKCSQCYTHKLLARPCYWALPPHITYFKEYIPI